MKLKGLLCCSILFVFGLLLEAAPVIQPNDRIAICGDAFTYNLGYSSYVEDYLLGCQPVTPINISAFGSCNTAGQFLTRVGPDLLPYKPTVVLLNFGTFDDPASYHQSLTDLIDLLKKSGVRTIVVSSPRCADSVLYHNDPALATARNNVLAGVAATTKEIAAQEGVIFADVFGSNMAAMKKWKAEKGDGAPFDTDKIWESTTPQSIDTAGAILKAMGFDGNIGTFTIDFAAGKADATAGHKIVAYQGGKVTIESTVLPFAYTCMPGNPPRDQFMGYTPFNDELNRLTLVVKNLPTARTKILWNDENYDFPSADLAKGINLSATTDLRCYGTFQNISGRVPNLRGLERLSEDSAMQGKPDPQAEQKHEAAFQELITHETPARYDMTIHPLVEIENRRRAPSRSLSIPICPAIAMTSARWRCSIRSCARVKPTCWPASPTRATAIPVRSVTPSTPITVTARFLWDVSRAKTTRR